MRQRTHKCLYSLLFAIFAGGLVFCIGCTDNPESQAAKQVREETSAALEKAVNDKQYKSAQDKVMAALVRNRTAGLTHDASVVASGNLALSYGTTEQIQLDALAQPVRGGVDTLAGLIRRNEELMIEKERIQNLLASDDRERTDLQKILKEGTDREPSLEAVRTEAQTEIEKLTGEKDRIKQQLDQVNATRADYQARADELLRQAELAQGEQKLTLQQQGYDILKQQKQYEIQAQEAASGISSLDSQIALLESRLTNLDESFSQVQSRIDAIENSQARQMLTEQAGQIESMQALGRQEMTKTAALISERFKTWNEAADRTLAIFEEAKGEFEKVQAGGAAFAAVLGLAQTSHQAALVCAAQMKLRAELNDRLVDLLQSAEPSLSEVVQNALPIGPVDEALKQRTMDLFGKAFENYQQVYEMASAMGAETQCSVLKSHMLAVSQKMQLADRIGDFDLANQTEVALNELMKKGTELGASFTQSEAVRVIQNEGLNYAPDLPLNLEVLAEGLNQKFSDWKRLPLSEQEQAIDANLAQIDDLIVKHGQKLAQYLEPLKQDMLAAKERGFKEIQAPAGGEPNSL
ncbi:MAG: hypothetical protein LLF76_12965 [Planctomycetaceae bacterium]|nr:hypothetical protein [Planctomycetaceae bacterium]